MARSINRVTLLGNLGDDPVVAYGQSGSCVTTISVATSESWKDKDGQLQERTEWSRVKFFGKLAEIAGEYLKKGQQVYIDGQLRTSKYTDKQGVEKYSTDIIANEMLMLGGRPEGERGAAPARGQQQREPAAGSYGGASDNPTHGQAARNPPPSRAQQASDPFPDDDLPF
jgi:single-strand DNA-binding protein